MATRAAIFGAGLLLSVVLSACGSSSSTSPLHGPVRAFDQCLRDASVPLVITNPTSNTDGSTIFTTNPDGPTVGSLEWARSHREVESAAHPRPPNDQLVLVRHRYLLVVFSGVPHKYAMEAATCASKLPIAIPPFKG